MDRLENQVLNEIRNFAERYIINEVLEVIDNVNENSSKKEIIVAIGSALGKINTFVVDNIAVTNGNEDYRNSLASLSSTLDAMKNNKGYYLKTVNYLKAEDLLLKKYSNIYVEAVKENDEKSLVIVEDNKELDEKITVNGRSFATAVGVVVLTGVILFAATKCENRVEPVKKNEDTNKPSQEEAVKPVVPVVEEKKTVDLEYATLSTYDNWSNITDEYTIDEIREVIKALNGLESSISINEADDVLNEILNKAIEPRINSIVGFNDYELNGNNGQPKILDLSSLILDKEVKDNYYNTHAGMMNTIMNNLIIGESMKESADKSLTIELDVIANGTLNNATPIEKILFSRTSIYSGVIAGVASETFDNGALIDSLEDMAVEAMNNTKGLTK